MKSILLAGTAVFILAGAAAAQTPAPASAAISAPQSDNTQQQVQRDLAKAGFTEIRIAPESLLVHAKDKAGNPVMMILNSDSFTEVAAMSSGPQGVDRSRAPHSTFVTVPATERLSSNLVGLDVYNNDHKDVGTIKDLAMNRDGVQAYILSVGGFLGIGDHYVAVSPDAVKVSFNETDRTWHAGMNATADQLKAAPEFKYAGQQSANKT